MIFRQTNKLDENCKLAIPIYLSVGDGYNLLLREGTFLSKPIITRLLDYGYEYVYIEDDSLTGIELESLIPSNILISALSSIERFYVKVAAAIAPQGKKIGYVDAEIEKHIRLLKTISIDELKNMAMLLAGDILSNNFKKYGSTLQLPYHFTLPAHVLRTSLISLLLAKELGCERKALELLAFAGFLHDIGLMALGLPVGNLWRFYFDSETKNWKYHPALGKSILDYFEDVSDDVKNLILKHHEYRDGSGYPQNLKIRSAHTIQDLKASEQKWTLGEVLTVANDLDQFSWNITTGAVDDRSFALMKLVAGKNTKYHPQVVQMVERMVEPFPLGSMVGIVKFSGKRYSNLNAVVVRINENDYSTFDLITLANNMNGKTSNRITINLNHGDIIRRMF